MKDFCVILGSIFFAWLIMGAVVAVAIAPILALGWLFGVIG